MLVRTAEVTSLLHEWNGTKKIHVEVGLRKGFPQFQILGLASTLTKESRDRVRLAIESSGFSFPLETIVVNLKPNHLAKRAVSLDLAIAVGVLYASEQIPRLPENTVFLGQLGLDGSVYGGEELLPFLWQRQNSDTEVYCLGSDLQGKSLPSGNYLFLSQLEDLFRPLPQVTTENPRTPISNSEGWREVVLSPSQSKVFQGLLYSALGRQHSILLGAPGSGKTFLHRLIEPLLPPLSEAESKNRLNAPNTTLPSFFRFKRPFRIPHHSISEAGLLGGGSPFVPGEITKAHGGILFIDEALECKERLFECLRTPMEDKAIELVRWRETTEVTSDFTLMLSSNPCPCGNYQSHSPCHCSLQKIRLYLQKISGAFLDRISIFQTLFDRREPKTILWKEKPTKERLAESIALYSSMELNSQGEEKFFTQCEIHPLVKGLSLRKKKQLLQLTKAIAAWNQTPNLRSDFFEEAIEYNLGYVWMYSM